MSDSTIAQDNRLTFSSSVLFTFELLTVFQKTPPKATYTDRSLFFFNLFFVPFMVLNGTNAIVEHVNYLHLYMYIIKYEVVLKNLLKRTCVIFFFQIFS